MITIYIYIYIFFENNKSRAYLVLFFLHFTLYCCSSTLFRLDYPPFPLEPGLKGVRFGSYFLKLFFRTVLENIENIILVFFKNYSYYLNLVFFVFYTTKKNLRT